MSDQPPSGVAVALDAAEAGKSSVPSSVEDGSVAKKPAAKSSGKDDSIPRISYFKLLK